MLRILLAFLCAFAGLPSAMAGLGLQEPTHDHCCCCADHAPAPEGPTLAENACGCGCLEPVRTPDAPPEPPRDRDSSSSAPLHAVQMAASIPAPPVRTWVCGLDRSAVPLRAPPPRAALGIWQE